MAWSDSFRYDKYLFIHAAPTIFAARVDQGSFTYPLSQITFDTVTTGAFGDIVPGMTVLFGSTAGASDLGRQRIRKAATSTVIFPGWSSRGIRDGELNLADNAYITVIDDYRAWAKIPRITDNGTLFKDFDIAAATGTPSPPVANGGVGVLQFIDDSTELITVDFDGTNSFTTAAGATISTYAWDFVDGTPASSAASTVAGVTFPQGFRWVSLTVTDSNGKQHTTRIPVAAIGEGLVEADYTSAVFTASSTTGGSSPDNAFDGNSGTFWVTASPNTAGFLKVQFPTAKTIPQYTIQKSCVFPAFMTAWTMEGSNDDLSYTVLDTQTGQTLSGDQTYTPTITGSFLYYRLNITGSNDSNQVGLCEWNLFVVNRNYFKEFEVTSQTLTRNGQNISLAIHEDIPADTYYDGALMMYGENEYYNDVKGSLAGPTGRENVKWRGWHDTDPASLTASESTYITTTEFSGDDIGGRMRKLPAFPQAVLRDASPTTWLQLAGANTDRYCHYLLHWHSTVLDVAPYTDSGTGDTYGLPRFQSPGQNLFEQIAFRAASIAHELTITMRGQLGLTPDPQLQDPGDRTGTVITDIDPSDWGTMNYTHQRPPRTYWLWGNAVIANTQEADASDLKINAAFCVAPGKAPGQGETEQTQGEQLVSDQDELNTRTGHQYARINAFQSLLDTAIIHPGDIGIDPALMQWVRQTITSDLAAQRGLTLTDQRTLPFEVDIVHNNITQTKEQFLRAELETEGTPAATVVPETGDVLPETPDIDEWPWIWEDEEGIEFFRGQSNIAGFDNSGLLHVTTNFDVPEASGGPDWDTIDLTGLSPALSGDYLQMVGDPFSPKYLGTGTTVNGWILTKTGIYSITDIFGVAAGPTLALQHTLATAATASDTTGFMGTGVGVQNWVVAMVYYDDATGTRAIRTTDGGSTWTESSVTAHYDTGADVHNVWVFVSSNQAGLVYTGAFPSTGSGVNGDLYVSTDFGATWGQDAGAIDFGVSTGGTFHKPWHDNSSQNITYYNRRTTVGGGIGNQFYRLESDGVTNTLISPASAFNGIGVRSWWSFSVCPIDRQRVLGRLSEERSPSALPDRRAVFTSKDAGDTWTQATAFDASPATYYAIAGNDPDIVYGWGNAIVYSQDYFVTYEDKTTKLALGNPVINLIGG